MASQTGLLNKALTHFRSRRMRLFEQTFQISERTRVLDIGGSTLIWEFATVRPQLTILNLPTALAPAGDNVSLVAGDGRHLPFEDAAFDIVFSNSVIEHVGTRRDQQHFAAEVARVGRNYWVQTPNRHFPIELHLMLPLIHYLPKRWQRPIAERFTIWQLLARPSEAQRRFYVDHFLNDLNLLTRHELQSLFPDGRIMRERFLGWPKSLIAVRLPTPPT
jgi:Methyltransferase domain